MIVKLLNIIGLTTLSHQRELQRRLEISENFATVLQCLDDAAIVVGTDNVMIRDLVVASGRRIIVAPGAKNCVITGCTFTSTKSVGQKDSA